MVHDVITADLITTGVYFHGIGVGEYNYIISPEIPIVTTIMLPPLHTRDHWLTHWEGSITEKRFVEAGCGKDSSSESRLSISDRLGRLELREA